MGKSTERTAGWRAAEERIGSLYRAFKYTVTRDVDMQGSQIDLCAERPIEVLGKIRIGVEIKDHPGRTLPIDEVRAFASTANLLINSGEVDYMVLVTTGKITKGSRKVVEASPRIRLMMEVELERDLFAPDAGLGQWLESYRREPINNQYVEIQTTLLELDSTVESAEAPGRLASTDLRNVAVDNPSLAIVVLADYGSGKSTMLDRIKATAIELRTVDPDAPVPLLIRLRDISADFEIEQVALAVVRSELGLELTGRAFWGLLRSGRFLILLDGFDEITLRANEATREQMLSGISPLLFGPSPAILTSRPSYFASMDEYRQLLARMRRGRPSVDSEPRSRQRIDDLVGDLMELYREKGPSVALDPQVATYRLDPLNDEQINEYLEHGADGLRAVGTSPAELRAFLDSVYDLSDLISRPIILNMAYIATIRGNINPSDGTLSDGPSGLYEAYALTQVERDRGKVENRRSGLSHGDRMRFAEECALFMDETDLLRIDRDQIREVIERSQPSVTDETFDEVVTDLRTCSFLTIDERGDLEFIHRSYQEFFVARKIHNDLAYDIDLHLRQHLRWEYIYFLGSWGLTDNDTYQKFNELSRARTPNRADPAATAVADNAAQALLVARDAARALDWHSRHVDDIKRKRVHISQSTMKRVRLQGLTVGDLELSDSELDVHVSGDAIGQLAITECSGTVFTHGTIEHVDAVGGTLDLDDRSTAARLTFNSMHLDLRLDRAKVLQMHTVQGTINSAGSEIDLRRCDVALAGTGTTTGTVADCLIELPLELWEHFAAQLSSSVVVVRGRRSASTVSTARHRTRKVTDDSPAGAGSVIVLSPTVMIDRWWTRQNDLVTFGASIPEATTDLTGLFVHELEREKDGQDVLHVNAVAAGTVVVTGRGPAFNKARARLNDIVAAARPGAVADGSWIGTRVRPFLVSLGIPPDQVEELAVDLRSRAHRPQDDTQR